MRLSSETIRATQLRGEGFADSVLPEKVPESLEVELQLLENPEAIPFLPLCDAYTSYMASFLFLPRLSSPF